MTISPNEVKQINSINKRIEMNETTLGKEFRDINNKIANIESEMTSSLVGHIIGHYDLTLFGIFITLYGTVIQLFY